MQLLTLQKNIFIYLCLLIESLNNFGSPFSNQGIESMYNLAQKCMQLKPPTGTHRLTGLLIGILEENTEVIVKRYCSCAIVFSFQ
jgi:hypothetical protein